MSARTTRRGVRRRMIAALVAVPFAAPMVYLVTRVGGDLSGAGRTVADGLLWGPLTSELLCQLGDHGRIRPRRQLPQAESRSSSGGK